MTQEELDAYLDIIFQKELSSLSKLLKLTWKLSFSNENEQVLYYEHSDTIIELYENLETKKLKSFLIDKLVYLIETDNDKIYKKRKGYRPYTYDGYFYISTSALAFYTLLRLMKSEVAIISLENRNKVCISGLILHLLHSVFNENYNYFSIKQLKKLIKIIKTFRSVDDSDLPILINNILDELSKKGYDIIKKHIKDVNIEINRDKEKVKELINYLNFDKKYNFLLSEIDKYIYSENLVLSSGMIGNLRSFMEEILTDLAKKISKKENAKIPKYKSLGQMGNIRKYLKSKLELSDADNSLINKYIDILHSKGGHSFISTKEYFRLSRNIGIEIILFLLSKYEKLYNT